MKQPSSKISVVVRSRTISDNVKSLYLDINSNGKRKRENLELYLLPGKSIAVKEQNRKTLEKANAVADQRSEELTILSNPSLTPYQSTVRFLDYFKEMCIEMFGEDESQWKNYRSTLRYLELFCRDDMSVENLTREWVLSFMHFLDTAVPHTRTKTFKATRMSNEFLKSHSKLSYLSILKKCVTKAYMERLIPVNPFTGKNAIILTKRYAPTRSITYLCWDEIQKLYNAPCANPEVKQAFLFCCYTGLRFCEVTQIQWKNITYQDGGAVIEFSGKNQSRTRHIPIPPPAMEFLGNPQSLAAPIFDKLKYCPSMLSTMRSWAINAGVEKDFTFHASRHTHIIHLLKSGVSPKDVTEFMDFKCSKSMDIYKAIIKEESL